MIEAGNGDADSIRAMSRKLSSQQGRRAASVHQTGGRLSAITFEIPVRRPQRPSALCKTTAERQGDFGEWGTPNEINIVFVARMGARFAVCPNNRHGDSR